MQALTARWSEGAAKSLVGPFRDSERWSVPAHGPGRECHADVRLLADSRPSQPSMPAWFAFRPSLSAEARHYPMLTTARLCCLAVPGTARWPT